MIIDGFFSHRTPPSNRRRIMGGPWSTGDRLWEMNCAILGLGLSVAGAICITGALKNVTGKPRPDVIARYPPPFFPHFFFSPPIPPFPLPALQTRMSVC